jgi:hypothetical protein
MSRNSSGTYSPPAGQPVIAGSIIDATVENNLVADLGAELTDSLSRSGKGGMSAPLRTADGTVAAPAHAFTSETGSGWFRIAAGRLGAAILGVLRVEVNATGVTIPDDLDVTGAISFGSLTGQAARSNLPTVGEQVSASSGSFTTNSGSLVDVTNVTVTITTTGRPVVLSLQPDDSGSAGALIGAGTQGSGAAILVDGTAIATYALQADTLYQGWMLIDPAPTVAAHTYKLQVANAFGATGNTSVTRMILVAYEL